jgi:uncharacterized membrane protein YbhN (UPF0104 family)
LLVYTIAVWTGKAPLASLLSRLPLRGAAAARLAHAAASAEGQIGLFCRQNPLAVLAASLLSALIWVAMTTEYWLALRFLGIQVDLLQAIAALTAASVSFLIPLPGGLGALEASQVLAMEALGFTSTLGLSVSLLIRGRDIILGGFGVLWGGVLARRRVQPVLPAQATE